eukprot:CAMPEP_0202357714 /NCGR_PEP_ID=MMETSP1126-20121109/11636_1 /ASSEMBLY_ACC=CAM_ASM_000457 /TAXON_ID=3047 /ORGANISM="Dunaliella tertiolecta, Strain CCMP1320" /LENGTH=540 /DNA_ID=CAMNT_0048950661 /DNA_START=137 /DNA_END=1759 /DNA_ORIENTATION=+
MPMDQEPELTQGEGGLSEEEKKNVDQTLYELYKSRRPPVSLCEGVPLSAIINATWLPSDSKAMLAESWIPVPPEPEYEQATGEPKPPPPSFDPKDQEYNEMARRLSKSAPLRQWNSLMIKTKELEKEMDVLQKKMEDRDRPAVPPKRGARAPPPPPPDDGVREARLEELRNEVENANNEMQEAEAAYAELRGSFAEDPLSLVPWMQTLFALADAGMTTFDVSGRFFPFTNLRALFSSDNSSSYYEGTESVLGMFKRRYEKERGPNKIQILTKLVPNHFQDGYICQEFVPAVIERVRGNVFGYESTEPLDLVQLHWWDVKEHDVLPTLKALQALTEDKLEVVDPTTGELAIAEPKKVRAIGLVDFPPRAILSAIQAGVPVVSLQCPFSIADRSHMASLEMAREYNIKVLARDGLMGGLVSEKYLGVAAPSTTGPEDPDLDEVAHALELANNYGGWEKTQELLKSIKAVADKHGVTMQTVALRWQIDQGLFPIATIRWSEKCWNQFGFYYHYKPRPGVDAQLFQVESFLDEADMQKLSVLGL